MIVIFAIFILLLLYDNFYKTKFYNEYLSKDNTTRVNGFFIILVFFSHFQNYIVISNPYDEIVYKILWLIGQFMVTTFFFFSGYGIYESVKKKGEEYVGQFLKHRFIPTYTNWCFAIIAFLFVNIIMQNSMTIEQVILSFIGWESIGNSNWYMFDIFVLYIIFMISFNIFKKENLRICGLTFMTILFISALSLFKGGHWYNTLLCFPLGMVYSYYKEKIDSKVMKNNKIYCIYGISALVLFIISFFTYYAVHIEVLFNIASCFFVLLISIALMKVELKSKILFWCGKNLFWIYILQRIPMMVFKDRFSNYNLYFVICFITTILIVFCINYIKQKKIDYKKIRAT